MLPFEYRKYQCGYILNGLSLENVDMFMVIWNILRPIWIHILWLLVVFCGHFCIFYAVWYISWRFGIVCGQLVCIVSRVGMLYQENAVNTVGIMYRRFALLRSFIPQLVGSYACLLCTYIHGPTRLIQRGGTADGQLQATLFISFLRFFQHSGPISLEKRIWRRTIKKLATEVPYNWKTEKTFPKELHEWSCCYFTSACIQWFWGGWDF
jgi:hypothetical protein